MRHIVVHTTELPTGEKVAKWFPSSDYERMAEHLLHRIEREPKWLDWLAVPFVLTLSASLEANLNDWLTLDALRKHGRAHYKSILDAHLRCSFSKKLRLAVATLTNGHFHLREGSITAKALDELIAVRNKVTHPSSDFLVMPDGPEIRFPPKMRKHPVHSLNIETLRRFNAAVLDIDEKLFRQYDKNRVEENDILESNPHRGVWSLEGPSGA